jgi:hypothetical protein
MVQLILSAMDSDEVNSVGDTVEATQVAKIIKSVFYDMATDLNLPEHESAFQLVASGDPTKPTLMSVPENVTLMKDVYYNYILDGSTVPEYHRVEFKPFIDFVKRQQSYKDDTTSVNMTVRFNNENFVMRVRTNDMPRYYTTIDDNQIIFDSYDEDEASTLQKSKTLCQGTIYPPFNIEDTFYPDLDPTQYSLLINRAKVRAFNELKQQANAEAAGEARRQKIIVQKRKRKVFTEPELFRSTARFGRK